MPPEQWDLLGWVLNSNCEFVCTSTIKVLYDGFATKKGTNGSHPPNALNAVG